MEKTTINLNLILMILGLAIIYQGITIKRTEEVTDDELAELLTKQDELDKKVSELIKLTSEKPVETKLETK